MTHMSIVSCERRRPTNHHAHAHCWMPDDLLSSNILPYLPFKTLVRFKSVSKNWLAMISADPYFTRNQSLNPSPISTGYVYLGSTGLEFLPSSPPLSLGVPDPSLSYIPENELGYVELAASTNGLLCLSLSIGSLLVFNPATRQGEFVPPCGFYNVGLAFNPYSNNSHNYTLVALDALALGIYRFSVFSAHTNGKWVKSRSVVIGPLGYPEKSVFDGDVLYWDLGSHLLWFHVATFSAGSMAIPGYDVFDQCWQATGVSEGRVTVARARCDGVEVWMLVERKQWEKVHGKSWEEMIVGRSMEAIGLFGPTERGPRQLASGWVAQPLPFDGGEKVYLGVKRRWWKVMKMVCYDMRTGEVVDQGKELPWGWGTQPRHNIYSYHNSMVDVPRNRIVAEEERGDNIYN